MARAHALGVADQIAWRRLLLHDDRSGARGGSTVDSADFFLAKNGSSDPAAELDATLLGFFAAVEPGREDAHAACRFPARRLWVESQIGNGSLGPAPPCAALARYMTQLDIGSASLVYASNFIENPASAFGHTFLRLHKRRDPSAADSAQANDRRDRGVDYTAFTDTANPFLHGLKGLTGFFRGQFRFRPYAEMIRDYAGYEARDLWEYTLALSDAELDRLAKHLWERAQARIDYFYLTENCSYQLVAALDAAVPRFDLVKRLRKPLLPLDTIKAVAAMPGLVRSIIYRPSVRSVFRTSHSRIDYAGREIVESLLKDPDTLLAPGLSDEYAALLFDTAKLGLEARYAREIVEGSNAFAQNAWQRLTERRAHLVGVPFRSPMDWAPKDKEPHKSHGSMRATLGSGVTSRYGSSFTTFGFRVALHDLADPAEGQPELLQLQFLDTRIRYDYGRERLTLDTLTFVEFVALNPLSRVDKKFSWRMRGFGTRLHDRAAPDAFAHGPNVSLGGAFATQRNSDRVLFFLMADAFAALSGGVDGIGGSVVRVGVGPFAGFRVRLPASTVALVTATVSYLPAQPLDATFEVRATVRSRLAKNVAIGLEGNAQPRSVELQLSSYFYF